jgi:hypothetical protein
MKPVHVLPRDGSHLELAEFGPNVALHDCLERGTGRRPVLLFDVLGDVAIK